MTKEETFTKFQTKKKSLVSKRYMWYYGVYLFF